MGAWHHPRVGFGSALKHWNIQNVRGGGRCKQMLIKGGWHFSNFYYHNISILVDKYASFSHQEVTKQFQNSIKYWEAEVKKGGNEISNTLCVETNVTLLPHLVLDQFQEYAYLMNEFQVNFAKKRLKQSVSR